jgi:putative SOS response-associated peptidase YedK
VSTELAERTMTKRKSPASEPGFRRLWLLSLSNGGKQALKGPNPKELLKPYPADRTTMWPVSPKLNSPKNDSPDLLEPIPAI